MSCCDMNIFQAEQCAIFVDAHDEYKVATLQNSKDKVAQNTPDGDAFMMKIKL